MTSKRFILASAAAVAATVALSVATITARALHYTQHAEAPSLTLTEQVRRVTQSYQDQRRAELAGYQPFLGCVSGPQEGAMGQHLVNPQFVGDGELDVQRPEALIYETRDGSTRLVGVEFLVIAEQWHQAHQTPPVFEGQTMHYNPSPNRYGLPPFYEIHVWAWRENPNGAFVDWNTHVSCEGQ